MDQSQTSFATYIYGVHPRVSIQHVPKTYPPLAGQSHVDVGFQRVSSDVPPAAASQVESTTTVYSLELEIDEAEGLVRKLQSYWAAVADDLGPSIWADPTNPYRQIWEREISSACDKLEKLEQARKFKNPKQVPKTACTAKSNVKVPYYFRGSGEMPSSQDMRTKSSRCDHVRIMAMREKHASHMRTLKRKATRQRAKARLVNGNFARSFQRFGNFTRPKDTASGSLSPRKMLETIHDSQLALKQEPMTLDELCHTFKGKEAETEASIRISQQFGTFRRPSGTRRSTYTRERIETVQDQLRALEQELTKLDQESKAERTLYVGDVPYLEVEDLQILFHNYDVASISVSSSCGTNQPPFCGFVTFWHASAARNAAQELSGRKVRGHQVVVRFGRNLEKDTWGDIY